MVLICPFLDFKHHNSKQRVMLITAWIGHKRPLISPTQKGISDFVKIMSARWFFKKHVTF